MLSASALKNSRGFMGEMRACSFCACLWLVHVILGETSCVQHSLRCSLRLRLRDVTTVLIEIGGHLFCRCRNLLLLLLARAWQQLRVLVSAVVPGMFGEIGGPAGRLGWCSPPEARRCAQIRSYCQKRRRNDRRLITRCCSRR